MATMDVGGAQQKTGVAVHHRMFLATPAASLEQP